MSNVQIYQCAGIAQANLLSLQSSAKLINDMKLIRYEILKCPIPIRRSAYL